MAQGWAQQLKADCIEAFSAGTMPAAVSSRAIEVMAEAGVDISSHTSRNVDDLIAVDFDYVITLCDNVKKSCPVFPGKAKLIHKPFSDPVTMTGADEEVMNEFRKVRDQIRTFIETLPQSLEISA